MKSYEKLISYIEKIDLKLSTVSVEPVYNHIGAVIIDSVLQAGLNYKTVVYPRVTKVIEQFETFDTTETFTELISMLGIENIINFNNTRKNRLIVDLLEFFKFENISNVSDLHVWLKSKGNSDKLLDFNGVGYKTLDYMKKLVGIDSLPVDRHISLFLELAGIKMKKYDDIQNVYKEAASRLKINLLSLDYTIWYYMAYN